MADVWSDQRCPGCGELVEKEGVLLATVNVTTKNAYQSYNHKPDRVRPLFQKGGGTLWHHNCLPKKLQAFLEGGDYREKYF